MKLKLLILPDMQVLIAPNQSLRVKTKIVKQVTAYHRQTVKEMIKLTKTYVDPEGVGLASTQVGLDEQFFVAKYAKRSGQTKNNETFRAYFNPKIIAYSKRTKKMFEGCLSIPNYWGEITRPVAITVSYLDEYGNQVKERLTSLNAHIFQHEYDHLQGKLFMDLVMEQKGKLYKVVGRDRAGAEVFEEVPL